MSTLVYVSEGESLACLRRQIGALYVRIFLQLLIKNYHFILMQVKLFASLLNTVLIFESNFGMNQIFSFDYLRKRGGGRGGVRQISTLVYTTESVEGFFMECSPKYHSYKGITIDFITYITKEVMISFIRVQSDLALFALTLFGQIFLGQPS